MTTKKIFKSLLILVFAFGLVSCGSDDDDQLIGVEQLPAQAVNFIDTHFPDAEILSITMDSNDSNSKFEVKLNNGFDIDFDENGQWTEVEGHGQQVPDAIIPNPVLAYVQSHYPDAFIEEISKKNGKIKIDLSNDIDLVFDLDGNFIKIDS